MGHEILISNILYANKGWANWKHNLNMQLLLKKNLYSNHCLGITLYSDHDKKETLWPILPFASL